MTKVSQHYIEGIKEGRNWLTGWTQSQGAPPTKEQIAEIMWDVIELRYRMERMAHSASAIEFYQGEIDFYRNQIGKA